MPETESNRVDYATASPGAILKRCREYHELTLEEAEESTKIGANYLAALEEDQVGQFASLAYLKGFLRIYATYLGLNPDDMIRLYEKLYSAGNETSGKNGSAAPGSASQSPRSRFPLQKLAMPAAILAIILLTSTIINRSQFSPARNKLPASATMPVTTPPVHHAQSSSRQPEQVRKPEDTVVPKRNDVPPPTPSGVQTPAQEVSRGFIVRLKVIQAGTIAVTIDGTTAQPFDLLVGDSIEWKADRTISFDLSNAGGVEAELNGRQLKPFGQPDQPATVTLDAEGIRP